MEQQTWLFLLFLMYLARDERHKPKKQNRALLVSLMIFSLDVPQKFET
jgi:hypothetical protein